MEVCGGANRHLLQISHILYNIMTVNRQPVKIWRPEGRWCNYPFDVGCHSRIISRNGLFQCVELQHYVNDTSGAPFEVKDETGNVVGTFHVTAAVREACVQPSGLGHVSHTITTLESARGTTI